MARRIMIQGVGLLVAALVGMAPGLRPELNAQDEIPPPVIIEPPTVVEGAARPHLKCYTMNVDTIKRPKGHKKHRDITIRDQFTRIAVPTKLENDPPLYFCEPMNKSTNPNKPPETEPVMLPSACYKARLVGANIVGIFHFRDQFFPDKQRRFTNQDTFFCDPVKAKLRVDMAPFTEDDVVDVLPPLFCYNFAKDDPVLQDVSATDQWRELGNIRIGRAINLCEPAVKNGGGEVPLPGEQPWICYEMGIAGKKPKEIKQAPILDKRVGWQDQFNVRAGLLKRPVLLCTPAEKSTSPFPEEPPPQD